MNSTFEFDTTEIIITGIQIYLKQSCQNKFSSIENFNKICRIGKCPIDKILDKRHIYFTAKLGLTVFMEISTCEQSLNYQIMVVKYLELHLF